MFGPFPPRCKMRALKVDGDHPATVALTIMELEATVQVHLFVVRTYDTGASGRERDINYDLYDITRPGEERLVISTTKGQIAICPSRAALIVIDMQNAFAYIQQTY